MNLLYTSAYILISITKLQLWVLMMPISLQFNGSNFPNFHRLHCIEHLPLACLLSTTPFRAPVPLTSDSGWHLILKVHTLPWDDKCQPTALSARRDRGSKGINVIGCLSAPGIKRSSRGAGRVLSRVNISPGRFPPLGHRRWLWIKALALRVWKEQLNWTICFMTPKPFIRYSAFGISTISARGGIHTGASKCHKALSWYRSKTSANRNKGWGLAEWPCDNSN